MLVFLVLFFLLAILFIVPIYVLLNGALSDPKTYFADPLRPNVGTWSFSAFVTAWKKINWPHYFLNTVILIAVGLVLNLFVSSTCAYSLSKLDPPFKRTVQFLLLCTLVLPNIVSLLPKYTILSHVPLLNINLINTDWPMWLMYATDALGILILKGFFDGIPKEMKEAAEIDGCGNLQFMIRFILPMSVAPLAVLSLFYIRAVYSDYINPLIFMNKDSVQPISVKFVAMMASHNITQSERFATTVMISIPVIIVAAFSMRFIAKGITFSGIKG